MTCPASPLPPLTRGLLAGVWAAAWTAGDHQVWPFARRSDRPGQINLCTRVLLAFCVRTQQSGATITSHGGGLFTKSVSFPRGLIPRALSSAFQGDVWGQMTKFWPRGCGGSNKLSLPGLAQENLLHEPSFPPSKSAHLTSAPRMTWNPCTEDAAPPSTPQMLRAEASPPIMHYGGT